MGGCRCTFRGCPNNSANSPGMHFFHYPLKFPERLDQWVKYANTKKFLDLPSSKARNKVVCESHFRDECFMNYKKERLVQFAVPTLVRLPNDMVLDFSESDNPQPKSLEPTKSKHLIRPDTENSSSSDTVQNCLSVDDEKYIVEAIEDIPPSVCQKRSFSEVDIDTDSSTKTKIVKESPAPKILNSAYRNCRVKSDRISSKIKFDKMPQENLSANIEHFSEQIIIETIDEQIHVDENLCKPEEILIENPEEEEELIQLEEIEYPKSPESEKISKTIFDEVVNNYEIQIKELKDKLIEKEVAEKSETTQVETVSTSRQPTGNTFSLTKAQLYSGIKKYLSPSMASIVRMEMFGGPERQWKSDEKNVSVELLKLGDSVFNYFRDEWRFRLPPKKDVQEWLSASNEHIEDEEDF